MIETILAVILSFYGILGLTLFSGIFYWNDKNTAASVSLVGTLVLTYLVYGFTLWLIPAYLAIGVAWSLWRWKRYVGNLVEKANSGRYRQVSGSWTQSVTEQNEIDEALKTDTALTSTNVSRIVNWMISWPVSLVLHVIEDLVNELKRIVTVYLAKLYEGISAKALEKRNK